MIDKQKCIDTIKKESENGAVSAEDAVELFIMAYNDGYQMGREEAQKELIPESLQSGIDDLLNENADLKARTEQLVKSVSHAAYVILEDVKGILKEWEKGK